MDTKLEPGVLAAFAAAAAARGEALDDAAGPLVEHVVLSGAAAWPELAAPLDAFARHVAARLPRDLSIVDALVATRPADVFLAFACSIGAPGAVEAFDATFGGEHKVVLARLRSHAVDADDFRQAVHMKLFASSPPRIAEYSGQGDLRHWLRVTLMRTLIDLSRARRKLEIATDDARVLDVPGPDHDPELAYLKTHYAAELRAAVEDAARELSAEDRNVLRAHLMHGLTIDEIGRMLGVHRATAARRVAKARDDLLAATRRRLMAKLSLGRAELDSVLRMIESTMHVSLARLLETNAAPPR